MKLIASAVCVFAVLAAWFTSDMMREAKPTLISTPHLGPATIASAKTRPAAGAHEQQRTIEAESASEIAPNATSLRVPMEWFRDPQTAQWLRDNETDYIRPLRELGVSEQQLNEVRTVLMRRDQARDDVRAVARENHWASAGLLIQATDEALEKFDQPLREAVGDQRFPLVKEMLDAGMYFHVAECSLAIEADIAGEPLSVHDRILIGTELSNTFDGRKNPEAAMLRDSLVDPETGLNALDRSAINHLRGRLSPGQIRVLQNYLARQHRPSHP